MSREAAKWKTRARLTTQRVVQLTVEGEHIIVIDPDFQKLERELAIEVALESIRGFGVPHFHRQYNWHSRPTHDEVQLNHFDRAVSYLTQLQDCTTDIHILPHKKQPWVRLANPTRTGEKR